MDCCWINSVFKALYCCESRCQSPALPCRMVPKGKSFMFPQLCFGRVGMSRWHTETSEGLLAAAIEQDTDVVSVASWCSFIPFVPQH